MATSKHASIRYEVLDRLLRRKSESNTQDFLRKRCCEAVSELDPRYESSEVSLRTFRSDINFLKNKAAQKDVDIICRPGSNGYFYYYSNPSYSIFNNELSDSEVGEFRCAMQLLGRFKGLPEYDGISSLAEKLEKKYGITPGGNSFIEYEHIDSTGEEIMSGICECIIRKQAISLTYIPYGRPEENWIIHPYYLKEYNNRWFLFGFNETSRLAGIPEKDCITNLALDRIVPDFTPVANSFIENTFIDFTTHFDDIIGVSVRNHEKQQIVIRVSEKRYPYIESKPIHQSQKYIGLATRGDGSKAVELSLDLVINRELDARILSYGADIEVVSPASYREHIIELTLSAYNNLYGVQDNCTPMNDLCIRKEKTELL